MYEKISEIVETKESTNNAFDDIFDSDELDTSRPAHYKSEYIRGPRKVIKQKSPTINSKQKFIFREEGARLYIFLNS